MYENIETDIGQFRKIGDVELIKVISIYTVARSYTYAICIYTCNNTIVTITCFKRPVCSCYSLYIKHVTAIEETPRQYTQLQHYVR